MKAKRAQRRTRVGRYLIGGFLLILLSLGGGLWALKMALVQPLATGEDGLRFEVSGGSNLSRVLRELEQRGVLKGRRLVLIYAYWREQTGIHAGEYLLPKGSNAMDLVARLNRGDVTRYRLTLVEGWSFRQALAQVRAGRGIVQSEAGGSLETAARALGFGDGESPEGWIFPDTYIYRSGTTDIDLLKQAHQRMQQVLDEEWRARADNLPYGTPYEALIMASLIEKETGLPSERSEIAGVFVRRLKRGMRLQTDPTVIYGLGDAFDGNLTRAHLRQATPYNTYVIDGLPPTPIALPGRGAIHAALNPKDGDSLYFVGKGDGSHHFSATLAEHNRAVREYQLKRRADYRSSPARGD
ncbi:endolytic transglycosylase MltG [Microbulbifer thermotolerans]|uniref:endolytic transglycosylase MltG n=1 Tax=Microbulbifer thermotolerans TaxID=252514 RepID=UPI002671AA31|nr:endolytic transglycosylase MltG [Microbulbifer thermotolerans]WKT62137.1 endolytic transglycosylase MltG [Microbulbifer thermotolerans]